MSDESLQEQLAGSPVILLLGAVLGLVLVVAAVGGGFYVEHRAINTARSLEQGAAAAITVPADRVDPANEGKLVHVIGKADTSDPATDPELGISAPALRLTREVETYQYKENKEEEKKKDSKPTVTYTYDRVWSKDDPPKKFSGPKAPTNEPRRHANAKNNAPNIKLGAFTLPPSLIEKIPANEDWPVTADMLEKLPDEVKKVAKVTEDGLLFVGVDENSNPKNPQIGDERIRFKVAKPQTVSVLSGQSGSTFAPYTPQAGEPIDLIEPGERGAKQMLQAAEASSNALNWILRAACLAVMALGVFLIGRRQVAVSSGLPPETTLHNVGLGVFAVLVGAGLLLIAGGGRWVAFHPLIGAGLLAGGLVALLGTLFVGRMPKVGLFVPGAAKWTAQERDYFRRIAIDPDNAPLRLEFAGVLEKKGNPVGEYIRLDQQLEDLPKDDDRREKLETRQNELLQENGKKWFTPLRRLRLEPKIADVFCPFMWMHHGIIDQVLIDLPGILPEKADQLFDAAPGLRVLEFHNIRTEAGVGGWKDTMYNPDVPAIVQVPHLVQVGAIKMSSLSMKTEDLEAIASSPNLENLSELDFSYNKVGPEGAVALAQSATLKRLRVLELRACDVGEEGAVALAKSDNLAHLVTLILGANAIGPNGVKALALCPHLKNLTTLALDENNIGPGGAQVVAASGFLRKLTSLDLGHNEIGPDGALALAKSHNVAKVTTLKLNDNRLGAGARFLAASPQFGPLKVLDLSSNEIDDAGATALAAGKVMLGLEELSLSYNHIGDAGIKALAAWPGLAKLNKLSLRQNQIGVAGVTALAASPHLRGLTELDLGNNPVGAAGAKALAASPALANLKYLWIQEAQLTPEGEKALRKRFGDVAHVT
jgi:Ran GTPase-activating protein (RanGAP) involved in mRNA processing and transport